MSHSGVKGSCTQDLNKFLLKRKHLSKETMGYFRSFTAVCQKDKLLQFLLLKLYKIPEIIQFDTEIGILQPKRWFSKNYQLKINWRVKKVFQVSVDVFFILFSFFKHNINMQFIFGKQFYFKPNTSCFVLHYISGTWCTSCCQNQVQALKREISEKPAKLQTPEGFSF